MAKENTNEQDSLLIIRWKFFFNASCKVFNYETFQACRPPLFCLRACTHTRAHTHPYTPPWSPPEVTTIWKMPYTLPEHEHEHAVVLSNTHMHVFGIYPH